MKKAPALMALIALNLTLAPLARAGGFCVNTPANPSFAALCHMQSRNFCMMNQACQWISDHRNGVCVNTPAEPTFAALCRMQTHDFCAMNQACQWVELD